MFKAKVFASRFREKLKDYFDMVKSGDDAVQIVHQGDAEPIRVLITQDHYLNLTSKIALYESQLGLSANGLGKEVESRAESQKRLKSRREQLDADRKKYGESIGE